MSSLHLVRMRVHPPALVRFTAEQGLLATDDEGFGYGLHAWLAASFGANAPQPFRWFEGRRELLGYANSPATALMEHAKAFASPSSWSVLEADSLVSKPMPDSWAPGKRLRAEVLACPVSRKEGTEKDVYLRMLDRTGQETATRSDVYVEWFARQWADSVRLEAVHLAGYARRRMQRRGKASGTAARTVRSIERPQALFDAVLEISDGARFAELLARGIGRHRAFGFGMILLRPAD
jgi:CRISPR system Cascade subunit CasE